MTGPQQPGPAYQGPNYQQQPGSNPPPAPQPGAQWQGPAGLPPYNQPPQKSGGSKTLLIVLSGLLAAALFMGAGILIGREMTQPAATEAVTVTETVAADAGDETAEPAQAIDETTPPNATDGFGILIRGKAPSEGVPHVIIWEDPQCPACAQYEVGFGPVIAQLVDEGKITAEARFAYFLDQGQPDGPSLRGAIAMAAADAVGKFDEYHALLFAQLHQGAGNYTDADLTGFAEQAGIQGDDLTRFRELYEARAFEDFVASSFEKFTAEQIAATPTFVVSGKRLQFFDEATGNMLIQPEPESFLQGVTAAWEAGGRQIEAPPEPR